MPTGVTRLSLGSKQDRISICSTLVKNLTVLTAHVLTLSPLQAADWPQTMNDRVLPNEIRLLQVLPHKEKYDSPIECNRLVVSLENRPRYEALSYVWGDPDILVDIRVAECNVGVTRNLYAAPIRLRLPHQTRSLWIDQLCINQWDTKEKAEQVRLMRQIYTTCQNSLLWMGEIPQGVTETDADQVMSVLRYMAASFKRRRGALPDCLKSDAAFEGTIKALEALSRKNPWWERVWTVQEAVLPLTKTLL